MHCQLLCLTVPLCFVKLCNMGHELFELIEHDRLCQLFEYYRELLSERQQKILQAYFWDDLSLSEIATDLNISRQAVHAQIQKAVPQLKAFEGKLKLLEAREMGQIICRKLRLALEQADPELQEQALQALEDWVDRTKV